MNTDRRRRLSGNEKMLRFNALRHPRSFVFIRGSLYVLESELNMSNIFADNILEGKVAFVTGGGTGITAGVARAFGTHGAKLAIVSRRMESLEAMKDAIESSGGQCFAAAADVRDFS